MQDKTILIFGGSGSLGMQILRRYGQTNQIVNFSRDAGKHWKMELNLSGETKLRNVVGDVSDYQRVLCVLGEVNPHIIIMAAALKYIERCEFNIHESLKTNCLGTKNVLEAITAGRSLLTHLETVVFVSTDKACAPLNVYGLCKAISEKLTIEAAYKDPKIKYVCVRYGNVLNSNGSIIPILHEIGLNKARPHFMLTHPEMTRFVMTLDESVSTIEHAILHGKSGEIIVPILQAMQVKDLIDIFADKYKKPIVIGDLRVGEKLHECLISEIEWRRVHHEKGYYHLIPCFPNESKDNKRNDRTEEKYTALAFSSTAGADYSSNLSQIQVDKITLEASLHSFGLLESSIVRDLDH